LEKSATKNERVGKQGNKKLMCEITATEKRATQYCLKTVAVSSVAVFSTVLFSVAVFAANPARTCWMFTESSAMTDSRALCLLIAVSLVAAVAAKPSEELKDLLSAMKRYLHDGDSSRQSSAHDDVRTVYDSCTT